MFLRSVYFIFLIQIICVIFFFFIHLAESESCSVVSYSLWPHGLYSPWNSLGQKLEWVAFPFSRGIFPTQGSNPDLPHCRWILYQLSHKRSPIILEWVAYPFSSRSSWPRNQTGVSCIAGRFFTNWTIWLEVYKLYSAFQRTSFDFIDFYLIVLLFSIYFFTPLILIIIVFASDLYAVGYLRVIVYTSVASSLSADSSSLGLSGYLFCLLPGNLLDVAPLCSVTCKLSAGSRGSPKGHLIFHDHCLLLHDVQCLENCSLYILFSSILFWKICFWRELKSSSLLHLGPSFTCQLFSYLNSKLLKGR